VDANITPIADRVLCRALPNPSSIGSVLVPLGYEGRLTRAEVVKVGLGGWRGSVRVPPGVRPGDVVQFDGSGIDWVLGQEMVGSPVPRAGDYFIIRQERIHGVVTG